MKKILMLAMLSTLAVGAFAGNDKPKKHKQGCENCTQKKCGPECKDKGACNKSCCDKA